MLSERFRYTFAVAVFCLIHGNWHDGSCWDLMTPRLRERSHDVIAPDLPFDQPGLSHDQRARPALEALEGARGEIVVVGHSAGSAEAGLVAAACRATLLVYLCPRLGELPAPPGGPTVFRDGFPFPARRADGSNAWEPAAAIAAMYPRLDTRTARDMAARLHPGAPAAGSYPLAAPPDVPLALIYTTEDEFFNPDWERFIARELLHVQPVELPGGHFPMIERPDELAGLLDRLTSALTTR
jgi:pimeloyl-ACP methyl ester carboxylesterase